MGSWINDYSQTGFQSDSFCVSVVCGLAERAASADLKFQPAGVGHHDPKPPAGKITNRLILLNRS
jgi:hypothetical protein